MSLADILSPTPENIARAAELIARGEVVGMPTETVYGLAGDAFNPHALTRIFSTKERPSFDPLIVHAVRAQAASALGDIAAARIVNLSQMSTVGRDRAEKLAQAFWPGPLTLVLPKHDDVPDLVTSGLPTVGVRMPLHPVAQALIRASATPLAAPSANRFGRISPTQARHVVAELGDRIACVLDGGASEIGLESTVLAVLNSGELRLLRPGRVSAEEIAAVTGVMPATIGACATHRASMETGAQAAPGMLASHYAPRKPLLLVDSELSPEIAQRIAGKKVGLLVFGKGTRIQAELRLAGAAEVMVMSYSPSGDLEESARHLFARLREMDEDPRVELIVSESSPSQEGLGYAIQDRLNRAAAPR